MCTYGYVRVSSWDQNEERQIDAMKRAGLAEDHLFVDKKSGKDFDRSQYKKMMKKLRKSFSPWKGEIKSQPVKAGFRLIGMSSGKCPYRCCKRQRYPTRCCRGI
jgi:predicted site-specific integrase-resolvase